MKTVNKFVTPGYEMLNKSVRAFIPGKVIIPLNQSDNKEYECAVSMGDTVKEGQVIASSREVFSSDNANIHSSVPGKVLSIEQCTLPTGKLCQAISIGTSGSFSFLGKKQDKQDWAFLFDSVLLDEFKNKGIVNTFGKNPVSLSSQIKKAILSRNKFVVIRLFDEDPSRYTDSFISEKYTMEVIIGTMIIAKSYGAEGLVFMHGKNQSLNFDHDFLREQNYCCIPVDTNTYPSGYKHNLIAHIRSYTKNNENKLFERVNHKCIFIDPETAYSVYEAIVLGIPVMERFIHITGNCLKSTCILRARIGTPISFLVEQCGGFKVSPSKAIVNGLVSGNSITSLDLPVTKGLKSIEFLMGRELCDQKRNPCIRCGKCREVCPAGLFPDLLYKHVILGYHLSRDVKSTAVLCSQCSLCNSICPSRLSLSQSIAVISSKENNND